MTAKARRENPKSVGKREQCVAGLNDGILNHLNPPSDVFCTVYVEGDREGKMLAGV